LAVLDIPSQLAYPYHFHLQILTQRERRKREEEKKKRKKGEGKKFKKNQNSKIARRISQPAYPTIPNLVYPPSRPSAFPARAVWPSLLNPRGRVSLSLPLRKRDPPAPTLSPQALSSP
jgi:hypothetical protein